MSTFSELIRQKEHVLSRLVPISVRQLEIVRSGDTTRLVQVLGMKQQLYYEFEEIEKKLAPHRDLAPEERRWNSEAERIETGEAIQRCAAMLQEIIRNDSTSIEETEAQKDEVEEQIRRTRQGTRLQNGYGKQAPHGEFRRFDKKS